MAEKAATLTALAGFPLRGSERGFAMLSNCQALTQFLTEQELTPDAEWWHKYQSRIQLFSRKAKNPELTRPKEIKKSLAKVENTAKEFVELLKSMPSSAIGKIVIGQDEAQTSKNFDTFETLQSTLSWVAERCERGLTQFPTEKGGRPRLFWRDQFIWNMAWLWEDVSGCRATITYDPYKEEYGGPFLRFLELSCEIAGFEYPSNASLARLRKDGFDNLKLTRKRGE